MIGFAAAESTPSKPGPDTRSLERRLLRSERRLQRAIAILTAEQALKAQRVVREAGRK